MTNDPWLKTSIMAKRGLAKGQTGKRHELSIAKQGVKVPRIRAAEFFWQARQRP